MTIHTGTSTEPQTQLGLSRQVGQEFDQNGHRSTLGEMIQMDGFFSLDEIVDRLPFRPRTFRKWAKKGPFTSCFKRVHAEAGWNSSLLLIHLSLFSSRFEELAELARDEDSKRGLPSDRAMDDLSGLHEFAELVIGVKQF